MNVGRRRVDWIQLAILLVTILAAAIHVESRLAKLEQLANDNSARLDRIEHRLDELQAAKKP